MSGGLLAAETEFCLLGPLLVRHREIVVPVPPGKQRALLVALLLSAERLVAVDELTEVLWGASPPPSARAALHNCVMRLRKSLTNVGPSRITTQPDGYLIGVGPADQLQQALALFRETGDQTGEAHALHNLGNVDLRRGRHQQAADHLHQALILCRETGDRSTEAYALSTLGEVDLRQGRYQQAADHLHQALALLRDAGDRIGEAETLNGIGELFLATGRPDDARDQHATALGLAGQIGDRYEQARAHDGLGRASHASGDPGEARHHWQQALALYTGLGAPEADRIRSQVATADDDGDRAP
jgi:tetratricopeptide (TPR) repeat protein